MKDRIRQIMESQHMTQQVFADFIGTTPATLSGIFNERTRPTINIIESIKKKIPDISYDWLISGVGDMYVHAPNASAVGQSQDILQQNGGQVVEPMIDFGSTVHPTNPATSRPTPPSVGQAPSYYTGVRQTPSNGIREEIKIVDKPKRHVTEIRVYYDDQTWESFVPAKK